MQSWPATSVPTLPGSADAGAVRLHDSSSGGLVDVRPDGPTARLYVCGITPYDATHLGHAATYLAFDTLVRVWRDRGLAVDYVQNVTDIDDPLLERAARDHPACPAATSSSTSPSAPTGSGRRNGSASAAHLNTRCGSWVLSAVRPSISTRSQQTSAPMCSRSPNSTPCRQTPSRCCR